MNQDPFEKYLKQFKTSEPEPSLRDRIMKAVVARKEGFQLHLFLKSWRFEMAMAAAIALLLIANVVSYQSGKPSLQAAPSQRAAVLMQTARRISAMVGENGHLAQYLYNRLRVMDTRESGYVARAQYEETVGWN